MWRNTKNLIKNFKFFFCFFFVFLVSLELKIIVGSVLNYFLQVWFFCIKVIVGSVLNYFLQVWFFCNFSVSVSLEKLLDLVKLSYFLLIMIHNVYYLTFVGWAFAFDLIAELSGYTVWLFLFFIDKFFKKLALVIVVVLEERG